MRKILAIIGYFFEFFGKAWNKVIIAPIKKARFAKCGKKVTLGKGCSFTYKNIISLIEDVI